MSLRALINRLDRAAPTNIGFPAAHGADFSELAPLLRYPLNNIGDPDIASLYPFHTKDYEVQILDFVANLVHAPATDRFGYLTPGGHESNLYALWVARTRYPDALVYFSADAHYSIAKAAHLLAMTPIVVPTFANGEMDYRRLRDLAYAQRDRPAVVVATIGTTMAEAVDDLGLIHTALDQAGVTDRHVHSDAALAGLPLAVLHGPRPGFDFADGADSIAISGHKFPGTVEPCGIVITRRSLTEPLRQAVAYTGSPDSTVSGSRSGHTAVMLWLALCEPGIHRLRLRADRSRELARYALQRLKEIGWPAWRNPLAITVMLRTPPPQVTARWPLPASGRWSHIVCVPGVTHDQIDALVRDLRRVQVHDNAPLLTSVGASSRMPSIPLTGRPASVALAREEQR
jgi:histidine decarboxylase